MNKDLEHLKLLSIFHYVLAGMCIFPILYGLFYIVMGVFFGVLIASAPNQKDGPPAVVFGGIFVVIGLAIVIVPLVFGLLLVKAGRNLASQKSYTFCLVIAAICCPFMPFGTALGVFTLVVLLRDSVKPLFNGQGGLSNYSPNSWQ